MKVTFETQHSISQTIFVHFRSNYGSAIGCWKHDSPPQMNMDYQVEFNIAPIILEEQVILLDQGINGFQLFNDIIVLTGDIEQIEVKENILYLRIASDGLLVVEYEDADTVAVGDKLAIKIPYSDLELAPY